MPRGKKAQSTPIATTPVMVTDPNDPSFDEPDAPSYEAVGLDEEFANEAREYARIKAEIKSLEAQAEEHREVLAVFMPMVPEKTVMVGTIRVTLTDGRVTKTLKRDKLVQLGVPQELIDKATDVRQGEPYVMVTETKR